MKLSDGHRTVLMLPRGLRGLPVNDVIRRNGLRHRSERDSSRQDAKEEKLIRSRLLPVRCL